MPRPTTRRPRLAVLCAASLLVTGCSGGEPDAVEPLEPLAPPDLCRLLPEAATRGLVGSSTTDEAGDPTAACTLRSETGQGVEVLVTWLLLQDDERAAVVWQSQCDAFDRTRIAEAEAVVEGADATCAASGAQGGVERASLAVRRLREVVTVRVTHRSDQRRGSLQRAQALAAGVLPALPGAR